MSSGSDERSALGPKTRSWPRLPKAALPRLAPRTAEATSSTRPNVQRNISLRSSLKRLRGRYNLLNDEPEPISYHPLSTPFSPRYSTDSFSSLLPSTPRSSLSYTHRKPWRLLFLLFTILVLFATSTAAAPLDPRRGPKRALPGPGSERIIARACNAMAPASPPSPPSPSSPSSPNDPTSAGQISASSTPAANLPLTPAPVPLSAGAIAGISAAGLTLFFLLTIFLVLVYKQKTLTVREISRRWRRSARTSGNLTGDGRGDGVSRNKNLPPRPQGAVEKGMISYPLPPPERPRRPEMGLGRLSGVRMVI